MRDGILVLYVDDQPDYLGLVTTHLKREEGLIDVVTASNGPEGLDRLADHPIDCIVSDFDMPEMDGLEFLRAVRDVEPRIPFILYTGKGSEEIASEAIAAGATDYLQKATGAEQYAILANRIRNAVGNYHNELALEETRKRFQILVEESTDAIFVTDVGGELSFVSPAVEPILGYRPESMVGTNGFDYIHPDDRPVVQELYAGFIERPEERIAAPFRCHHADGSFVDVEARGRNLLDEPLVEGIVVYIRERLAASSVDGTAGAGPGPRDGSGG